jgi:hypothetical protein
LAAGLFLGLLTFGVHEEFSLRLFTTFLIFLAFKGGRLCSCEHRNAPRRSGWRRMPSANPFGVRCAASVQLTTVCFPSRKKANSTRDYSWSALCAVITMQTHNRASGELSFSSLSSFSRSPQDSRSSRPFDTCFDALPTPTCLLPRCCAHARTIFCISHFRACLPLETKLE